MSIPKYTIHLEKNEDYTNHVKYAQKLEFKNFIIDKVYLYSNQISNHEIEYLTPQELIIKILGELGIDERSNFEFDDILSPQVSQRCQNFMNSWEETPWDIVVRWIMSIPEFNVVL